MSGETISVIIPTLNEVGTIANTLIPLQKASNVEIIVVDGGSQDGTVEWLKSEKVRVITAEKGRARQMNQGAIAAGGNILLFLHADTQVPEGFDQQIRAVLSDAEVIAGAFTLLIDASDWRLRVVERLVNWRSRQLQMPYGDQGLFLKTQIFHSIGKFPDLPIMEDFEMVRCLRQMGRIAILPAPVLTSARRWQKLGIFRTTLINQAIVAAYLLGIPPAQLVKWYGRKS